MAKGKGVGRDLGLKDRIRMKGQCGGVGAWVKGGQAGVWAREATGFVTQS